jgi:transposase
MLIALARKLAISLWRYVETGLVPEGVAIRAKSQCANA